MSANRDDDLKELITIRKLLILALLRSGMTQGQLGAALGVHRTVIGKMFPTGALAELSKKTGKKQPDATTAEDEQ